MARYTFGAGAADAVASNGRPRVGVTVTMWTAQTGGTQITDLLAADGTTPITSVTSGAEGIIPAFFGPDGVAELWALAGGARVRLDTYSTDEFASAAFAPLAHTTDVLLHSSGQEIDYAENASGTVQALTTTATNLAGLSPITVPVSLRPVWLQAEVLIDVQTTPAASSIAGVALAIVDEANVVVAYGHGIYTSSSASGAANGTVRVFGRLDPSYLAQQRVLRLQVSKDGNATFAANVLNGAIFPVFKSWLTANYR